MANFREQVEEMKILLSSKENKASAYSKLLQLQETAAVEPSSVQILIDSSQTILAALVSDIFENDEEIAAQALKCLGFMIYDPIILASIGDNDADELIGMIVKVIVTTKIKSVCNLGMWCISIQQFSTSILVKDIEPLIRALVHGLDNPFGSLSTTFEAMQTVVKLSTSLTEQMRNMSSVWTPPIYRRLISADKRDRDMSERCLLKIVTIICPPPPSLSKALAAEMKKHLFLAMKQLLDQGMKIPCLHAWGWFIRLLGPYAMKSKHMVNEMLKILEQTFSDTDSQVQIASLVAWEGLIDAFLQSHVQVSNTNSDILHGAPVIKTPESIINQTEAERQVKKLKLIMSPLTGVMSSKCDYSVHASCLSTWSYLLYKLDSSVSCHSVIKTVWEPIIEVVFQAGPSNKNIWFFNFCVDLLDALISSRSHGTPGKQTDLETSSFSHKRTTVIGQTSEKCNLKHYPINCAPWKLCQLDFFIDMIDILISKSNVIVTPECGTLASDAALKLFICLLEAVQRALRSVSITYDEVMQCLNTLFRYLEKICNNVISEDSNDCYPHGCLKFLEVVTYKLDSSILESPLYKVKLDLKCIKNLACNEESRCAMVPVTCSFDFEGPVLPLVYISTLYFSVVINSSLKGTRYESLLQQMQSYIKLFSSSNSYEEVLLVFISLLYRSTSSNRLHIWIVLARCIRDSIDTETEQSQLKLEKGNTSYSLVLRILSYPFASWSSTPISHGLQNVREAWKSLYLSINQTSKSVHRGMDSFSEDVCAWLNGCTNQMTQGGEYVLLYGSVIISILEQAALSISPGGNNHVHYIVGKSSINNCMELTAWFMKLLWGVQESPETSFISTASRFLSELVNFVRCLHRKEDILVLIEYTANPLLQLLSDMHLLDEKTNAQLQILWPEILKISQRSQPQILFDSSFLKLQGPLLEKTLDHPNPAISKPTINFWNTTYGTQTNLEFPQNLLPVLDKLSRNGKIVIFSRNHVSGSSLQRCTTLNKCSKRVKIVGNPTNGKRKRAELTEHQKEVRRAQQGKAMNCSRHGPGIRTYTDVDFSLGNEESQDSQLDIRDADSILEMLKKVR